MQVLCAGAVIAAIFTYRKWLDIEDDDTLSLFIDDEILLKTRATAAVAVSTGVVMIPQGIVMIVLLLFRSSYGIFDIIITVLVRAHYMYNSGTCSSNYLYIRQPPPYCGHLLWS